MIKAVLWDVDDTIFDYSGSERIAIAQHCEAEGLPGDEAAFGRWRQIMEQEYARFLAGELTFEQHRRERVRRYLDRPLADSEADAWLTRYHALFEAAWTAFPDAAPVLEALPYRQGILSNSSTALQERKLAVLGLRGHFEILLCSDELGCAKPDPAAFLAACSALDLAPAEIAYVGDRLDLDALGARDAGLHGIWLDRSGSAGPPPDGVHQISDLAELPGLLRARLDAGAAFPLPPDPSSTS